MRNPFSCFVFLAMNFLRNICYNLRIECNCPSLLASRALLQKKRNEVFPPHEWLVVQTATCSSSVYCSPAHTTALSVCRSNYFVMDTRYQLSTKGKFGLHLHFMWLTQLVQTILIITCSMNDSFILAVVSIDRTTQFSRLLSSARSLQEL